MQSQSTRLAAVFLSTPSVRRATRHFCGRLTKRRFLSTPSVRRATFSATMSASLSSEFLSTPSVRRATNTRVTIEGVTHISIHALRAEGDLMLSLQRNTAF